MNVMTSGIDPKKLHPHASFVRILGLNYIHITTRDGGDLYITEYGAPFTPHLAPENWLDESWFKAHRIRLEGSGTVYRVPTKPIDGRSIDLVVKWSRVGQDVPLNTMGLSRNLNAEFNTPFEEFALVEELRKGRFGSFKHRIFTQKPLAIYVPPEQMQLWQTGRSRQRILSKIRRHPGVEIDVLRSYIMLFGWVDGMDAAQAYETLPLDAREKNRQLRDITEQIERELAARGFIVADHKPSHFIVRIDSGKLKHRHDGRIAYALVDYELLARTREYDEHLRSAHRSDFAMRLHNRFLPRPPEAFAGTSISPCNVLGVDYIVARSESTGGTLWVVGNDPDLLPYFLPERWRQKQVKLSHIDDTWYAETKDQLEIVWKVSRVGELPPGDLADPAYKPILVQGYNSPFEEFAFALELSRNGVNAITPLAIYVTPVMPDIGGVVLDERRFEHLSKLTGPDGAPVLPVDHDYITVWSYWRGRGRGQADASAPQTIWSPINAADALARKLIAPELFDEILPRHAARLAAAGYTDPRLRPEQVLLAYIPPTQLQRNGDGFPVLCHCNFELLAASGQ